MNIFNYHIHPRILVLGVTEFFGAIAAVYLAAWFRFSGPLFAHTEYPSGVLLKAVVFAAAVSVGLTAMGLYQGRQRLKLEAVLLRIVCGVGLGVLGLAFVYFVIPEVAQGRGWWAISLLISTLLIFAVRALSFRVFDDEFFRRRVLVVGAGERASSLLQLRRRSDQRGFKIVGFLPASGDESRIEDGRVLSSDKPLDEVAVELAIDEIVVAMDDRRKGFPIRELLACKFAGISVVDLLSFLERESGRVKINLVSPSWIIFSDGFTRRSYRVTITRIFDIVASACLVAVTWPFMLAAMIAILLEDGTPVLYRQTRVGLLGKHFKLLKFRSMRKDAEAESGAQWATPSDPRITRVGSIMRKLRVDELPQLFNVIVGDMSFVGPRPERPEFVENLAEEIPYYHERHCVKPGLTGWAQLSYPYGSSTKDALQKLEYDLYYVKNQSVIFDLLILIQTVEVVLLQKGSR